MRVFNTSSLPCRDILTGMNLLIAALIAAGSGLAAEPIVIKLWPESGPSTAVTEKGADGERRTRGVNQPSITVHLPDPARATGTAVIVAPGGGYRHLTIDKEGHGVAKWFTTFGVAGILLEYRVQPLDTPPDRAKQLRPQVEARALEDAKQAMKIVRAHAPEWRIDPERIGFMGFSAGGHLTANLGMHFDAGTRPAFLGIFYGSSPEPVEFAANTPPVFLVHAYDDRTVPVTRATAIVDALKRASVPAEAHIYSKGGHGFGISKKNVVADTWPDRMREWMESNGWLRRIGE